jgi:hypothetical protein
VVVVVVRIELFAAFLYGFPRLPPADKENQKRPGEDDDPSSGEISRGWTGAQIALTPGQSQTQFRDSGGGDVLVFSFQFLSKIARASLIFALIAPPALALRLSASVRMAIAVLTS